MPETVLIIVYILLGFLGLCVLMLLMSFFVLLVVRVPFVRTPRHAIQALIEAKIIASNDLVFDLGAGDGKFLQRLVKATGCRGEGFEISPFFYLFGELRAAFSRHWKMHLQNFLNIDLGEPTVIFTFLAPAGLPALSHKLHTEVKPGTRIISYGFTLDGFAPIQTIDPHPKNPTGSKFYVYRKT